MPLIGAALVQMVHSPESLSYAFAESPLSPTAQVKNEFPRRSPGPASATTPTEHEAFSQGQGQGRRGSKKPRSIANMTQEQRDRKRENGEDPPSFFRHLSSRHPLRGVTSKVALCAFPETFSGTSPLPPETPP